MNVCTSRERSQIGREPPGRRALWLRLVHEECAGHPPRITCRQHLTSRRAAGDRKVKIQVPFPDPESVSTKRAERWIDAWLLAQNAALLQRPRNIANAAIPSDTSRALKQSQRYLGQIALDHSTVVGGRTTTQTERGGT